MKKVISIVLSLVMLLSVGMASVNALAVTVGSYESTTKPFDNKIITRVNGKDSNEIDYEKDDDKREITFTYTGEGKVADWEFPGMTEGVDYIVVARGDNWITIKVLEDYDGDIIADAILEEPSSEEPTAEPTTAPESTTAETTKKNEEQKSPATGASVAAGVAAMGAGAAILAALKRKNDAE